MDLTPYVRQIEQEMQALLLPPDPKVQPLYGMMAYHMGWLDREFRPARASAGKRFRPLLCLLTCEALGAEARRALPAAAAIELVHNFSLIHDDIEDSSPLRRHRETAWYIWGIPQAVNAGDSMFVLAHLALQPLLERGVPPATVLAAARVLDTTCLRLCEGQYLDLAFEERSEISVGEWSSLEEYLYMIGGKSASLIAASTEIGALLATEDRRIIETYRQFGWEMGLAFQMVDDILGIWGDPRVTGKSVASDILSKKKTLPILYALDKLESMGRVANGQALRQIYQQPQVGEADLARVLELLEEAGARVYVQAQAEEHTARALAALEQLGRENPAQQELREIAASFLQRTS